MNEKVGLICEECVNERKAFTQSRLLQLLYKSEYVQIPLNTFEKEVEHAWIEINVIDYTKEEVSGVIYSDLIYQDKYKPGDKITIGFDEIEQVC